MRDHGVSHNCEGFAAYFYTRGYKHFVSVSHMAACNCSLATALLSLVPWQIREREKPNFR